MPTDAEARRLEDRSPVHVTVDLSGLDIHTVAQQGVTENVSARGARVVTSKPWHPNDHVTVRSLLGNLRSRARVVYCQPLGKDSFAIGLELFVSVGEWTMPQATQRNMA
ncbi:MAG TPA: PilZ domain-containing protein [Candidatus Acidoferrum sp.]